MAIPVLEKEIFYLVLEMIFKIQTQIISMDSPQCPLSMHVSLFCENRKNHPFFRGLRSDRSDLETALLKGGELPAREGILCGMSWNMLEGCKSNGRGLPTTQECYAKQSLPLPATLKLPD